MAIYKNKYQIEQKEMGFISNLNAVRLCIVVIIAFGYASTMPLGPEHPEMLNLFGYDPSWIGLQVLFFISGILALRSISSGRTGFKYLSSRFGRNIPLLFSLTVATLIILFPLFGTPLDQGADFFKRVTEYVLLTTFCISPGVPIQGLMDDALYMCIVQGGIWTLRFGVVLHIVTAITGRLGWLNNRALLLLITATTTLAYISLDIATARTSLPYTDLLLTGLHFAYPFLLGMTAWAYREAFTSLGSKAFTFPIVFFILAFISERLDLWSALIDVTLALSFSSLAWIVLWSTHRFIAFTRYCPNLTLPIMLICWPIAQTALLIYPDITPMSLIALTLPITLILSLIVWALGTKNPLRFSKQRLELAKS